MARKTREARKKKPAARTRRAGRPSLLGARVEKKLVSALKAGATLESAASFAGIGRRTFHDWLRQGRDDIKLEKKSLHASFVEAIELALAQFEVGTVRKIQFAAHDPRFWTAGAFLLERRKPSEWGKRDAVPVPTPEKDEGPPLHLGALTTEQLTEFKRLLAIAQGAPPATPTPAPPAPVPTTGGAP